MINLFVHTAYDNTKSLVKQLIKVNANNASDINIYNEGIPNFQVKQNNVKY